MKKIMVFNLAFMLLVCFNNANAQDYRSALGVRLSSSPAVVNNSVSFKYFTSESLALEALLTFSDPVAIGLLFEKHRPFGAEGLQWFYGGGGYVGFGGNTNVGGMGIIGLDYKFTNVPLNLSLDWKPELNVISDINFEPAAIGFSARFTFGR
ncbi:MAG: hypothetical protein H0V30_05500 [Chitinophagaceae bacterium]|nr:hypothetical protein [Chitinophagaceae bacterium]